MVEVKPRNKYSNSTPPNSEYQILSHPSGNRSKKKSSENRIHESHKNKMSYTPIIIGAEQLSPRCKLWEGGAALLILIIYSERLSTLFSIFVTLSR